MEIEEIEPGECHELPWTANPYLEWPVVLDEYVKNRDVWRCPSQRVGFNGAILNPWGEGGNGDWWQRFMYVTQNEGDMGCAVSQCNSPFPPGWGGDVTDSYLQKKCMLDGTGGFYLGYSGMSANFGVKLAGVQDAARWLAVAERGGGWETQAMYDIAYPDRCMLPCAGPEYGCVDWENCPWTVDCGAGDPEWGTDPSKRNKELARHMGGVNIGFADGHARWYHSEGLLAGAISCITGCAEDNLLFEGPPGMCVWGATACHLAGVPVP